MKTFPLTRLEMLTLSALNPASAALVGWGINLLIAWSGMAEGKDKDSMRLAWIGMLVCGLLMQVISWGMLAWVWWECRGARRG